MSNFQERLIESMIKDFEEVKSLEDSKAIRKECALLIKRVESARKLLSSDDALTSQLEDIESKVLSLKNNG